MKIHDLTENGVETRKRNIRLRPNAENPLAATEHFIDILSSLFRWANASRELGDQKGKLLTAKHTRNVYFVLDEPKDQ